MIKVFNEFVRFKAYREREGTSVIILRLSNIVSINKTEVIDSNEDFLRVRTIDKNDFIVYGTLWEFEKEVNRALKEKTL